LYRYQHKPSHVVETLKRLEYSASETLKGLTLLFHKMPTTDDSVIKAPLGPHDYIGVTPTGDWIVKIAVVALSISLIGRKFGIAITPFHLLYAFGLAALVFLTWQSFRRR
jgi:hypothetical protein